MSVNIYIILIASHLFFFAYVNEENVRTNHEGCDWFAEYLLDGR